MTSRFSMALATGGARILMQPSKLRRLAPDLLEALGTAAAPFVVLVSDRILVVVILVVVLRRREGRHRKDLGCHLLLEAVFDLLLGLFGERLLLVIADEHDALIGAALVAELSVGVERVDIVPVMIEQLGVGDLGWVVGHLDGLFVTLMRAIGRVGRGAAGITRDGLGHAVDLVERGLHAPEATAGED